MTEHHLSAEWKKAPLPSCEPVGRIDRILVVIPAENILEEAEFLRQLGCSVESHDGSGVFEYIPVWSGGPESNSQQHFSILLQFYGTFKQTVTCQNKRQYIRDISTRMQEYAKSIGIV